VGAQRRHLRTSAAASSKEREPSHAVSRAELLRGLGSAGVSSLVLPLSPAPALALSLQEAQQTLASYGLPDIAPTQAPPGGWNIVVEPIGLAPDAYYGRFNLGGQPQVVTFYTPPLWVVSKPNIDFNGAAGTVQANDYGKGDSATLWVNTEFSGNIDEFKKKDYRAELLKALTTKGKNFIEGLKILTVKDGAPGYKIVEYDYDVESAAGFTIARSGVAAFCQVGGTDKLQIFWTAVVTPRWNSMQSNLGLMVNSFRIGNVPKNISNSMIKEFKNMDEAMSSADIPRSPFA